MLGFIILMPVGGLFLFFSYFIWKKERIDMIHTYHYKNVSEADKPAYCKAIGQAMLLMALAMIATGLVGLVVDDAWPGLLMMALIGLGFVGMYRAQKKYNGSIF